MSLTIIEELPPKGKNRGKRVRVECSCGKIFEARKSHVLSGNTTSCGCEKGKRKAATIEPKPKSKLKIRSHKVTPQVTKPKPVFIEEDIDEEEEEYNRKELDNLISAALENSPHLNEELFAESLGMRTYELREMDHNDLRKLLEEKNAL